MSGDARPSIRIDKWLWHARFFKTRPLAADFVEGGKVRVDGRVIEKPGYAVHPGSTLVFPLGPHVRSLRILGCGERRGPAPEARTLYEDLDPPTVPHA
ncbi:MAG: RNA-binding S4 domain-containing protein [Alphaproteobacteria bacterium]|nr:RNA-binding S4 domain-containing protein [Alphaproteobacteria bacterium]